MNITVFEHELRLDIQVNSSWSGDAIVTRKDKTT